MGGGCGINLPHAVVVLCNDEGVQATEHIKEYRRSGSRRGGEGHFLPPPAFWRIHKQYSKASLSIWYLHFMTIVGRLLA